MCLHQISIRLSVHWIVLGVGANLCLIHCWTVHYYDNNPILVSLLGGGYERYNFRIFRRIICRFFWSRIIIIGIISVTTQTTTWGEMWSWVYDLSHAWEWSLGHVWVWRVPTITNVTSLIAIILLQTVQVLLLSIVELLYIGCVLWANLLGL